MILLKVSLSEQRVADYIQPEGTRNPKCGAGINCIFCTLKMLGVYSSKLEKTGVTCGPRYAEGKPITLEELLPSIKEAIKDVTGEDHEFKFETVVGDPSGPLAALVSNLHPQEACFFIYGRAGVGSHAVVLRRGPDDVLELIDPQRGLADIGKASGFTGERAAELGLEVKPNYYRVRGEKAISDVIIEQSALFKYWPTKEAVRTDISNFVIGTLMVDNVVGLKMLIDDNGSDRMEVDDLVRSPKDIKMKERESQETTFESQEGGATDEEGSMTPPPSKTIGSPSSDNETQTFMSPGYSSESEDSMPFSLRYESATDSESIAAVLDWKDAIISEMSWTTRDDEEFVPKYEDVLEIAEDGTHTIERTLLDKTGTPIPMSGGAKRRPEDALIGPEAKRQKTEPSLTINDIKRTPEQKVEAEAVIQESLKPGVEGMDAIEKAVTGVVKHFYAAQDRGLFETQTPDAQCEGVFGKHEVQSEICWLCGFAQVAYAGDGKPYNPEEGGDPLDANTITNEGGLESSVCEHKLPVKVAHFFRLMYRSLDMKNGQVDEAQYGRIQKLYGTAHIICNIIKDNDIFLKSTLGDKTFGAFTENRTVIEKCMKNLISVVRKRASTAPIISDILPGSRFYYWGTLMMKQTGEGKMYYRNTLMYRLHKMEAFVASKNPYKVAAPGSIPAGAPGVPFTGQFTYASVGSVKKWLDIQYTNIVGGINELRMLLESERDTLYSEGVQVMNRKPFRENTEWWNLVKGYVPGHPDEAEEFKHGLRLPFVPLITSPKYKPIQRVWKSGDIGPQPSLAEGGVTGGHRLRITIRRRTSKNRKRRLIEVHI
jgi:hypothetical protein